MIIQLKNSTEVMLDEIDRYLNQIAFNSNIQKFSYSYEELTYKEFQDVIDKVNDAVSASAKISSCYIYYFESEKIIDSRNSLFTDLKNLNNRAFIEKVLSFYNNDISFNQFIFYLVNREDNTEELTIVKPINMYSKQTVALLIITIDPNYFTNLMDSININHMAGVYVTDSEGNVISSSNKQYNNFLKHIDEEKKGLIENNNTGNFSVKINGLNCLVSFTSLY